MNEQEFNELIEGLNKKTVLDISNNQLTQDQIDALAERLKTNTSLTEVDLSLNWTHLNDKKLTPIINTLEVNKTVKSINLSFNELDDQDAMALAKMLKINNTLTSLDICHNHIEGEGVIALAQALKDNITLTRISFEGTQMEANSIKELIKTLQRNYVLTDLGRIIGNDHLVGFLGVLVACNEGFLQRAFDKALDYYTYYMQTDEESVEHTQPNKKIKYDCLLINPVSTKDLFMLKTHSKFVKDTMAKIMGFKGNAIETEFKVFERVVYSDYVLKNLPKLKGWCKDEAELGDLNILPYEIKEHIFSLLGDDYLYPIRSEESNKVNLSYLDEIYNISDSEDGDSDATINPWRLVSDSEDSDAEIIGADGRDFTE